MWEAWFSLACLGTFRSLKIICGLHGIGYLETWFSQQPSGQQAHRIILSWPCLRRKRWNGNLPLDTDWASSWVYDYGSVRPCCLLAGRLGTNCLTSLRFSVPGYSSTPLLVVLKIKWYNPYKALGQSLSGSKCLLSPSFFTPRSSKVLDLWRRTSDWRKKWLILEWERWVGIHPEIGQRYITPNGFFFFWGSDLGFWVAVG